MCAMQAVLCMRSVSNRVRPTVPRATGCSARGQQGRPERTEGGTREAAMAAGAAQTHAVGLGDALEQRVVDHAPMDFGLAAQPREVPPAAAAVDS